MSVDETLMCSFQAWSLIEKFNIKNAFAFNKNLFCLIIFWPLKDSETCRQKEAKQISEVLTDFLQIKFVKMWKTSTTTLTNVPLPVDPIPGKRKWSMLLFSSFLLHYIIAHEISRVDTVSVWYRILENAAQIKSEHKYILRLSPRSFFKFSCCTFSNLKIRINQAFVNSNVHKSLKIKKARRYLPIPTSKKLQLILRPLVMTVSVIHSGEW